MVFPSVDHHVYKVWSCMRWWSCPPSGLAHFYYVFMNLHYFPNKQSVFRIYYLFLCSAFFWICIVLNLQHFLNCSRFYGCSIFILQCLFSAFVLLCHGTVYCGPVTSGEVSAFLTHASGQCKEKPWSCWFFNIIIYFLFSMKEVLTD